MIKAVLVKPDENPELIELEGDLESLQEQVGGYIEQVALHNNIVAIVNEEGRLKGMPFNQNATFVALQETTHNYGFVGNVLFLTLSSDTYENIAESFVEKYILE